MENKRKLLEEFLVLENYKIEDELAEIIDRFRQYNPHEVFWLINSLIMDNTKYAFENRDKRISPRLANRLFYLYKKNSKIDSGLKIKNKEIELEWLRAKFIKIYDYYCMEQFNQNEVLEDEVAEDFTHMSLRNFHPQNFLTYHFDYPDTSWFQYLRAIELNREVIDEILSKDNLTTIEVEKGLLICILYDFFHHKSYSKRLLNNLFYEKVKYKFEGFLTSFSRGQLSNMLSIFGIRDKEFIARFFPEIKNEKFTTLSYPTDKYYKEEFSLGVSHKERIFFPRSNFVLDEFWNYILECKEMVGRKDDFVELYTIMLLTMFFGKENVFFNLYDDNGAEQDIIVVCGEDVLCFECKSEVLKEPFRDSDKSDTRMQQNFKRVIQKAYNQGQRVKENIRSNKGRYYDSDKKESREMVLDLSAYSHHNVLVVCVTINNYLNLSNRVNKYLRIEGKDKVYPWVIDIFSLEHILNKIKSINKDEAYFIRYIRDRIKSYLGVQSMGAEELECFGYYLRYEKFWDSMNGSSMLNLGNGYATFVLDYIPRPEIDLMLHYFSELANLEVE
ncbi:hypothetical protein [Paenibacillus sp. NFR01]|uniref:hypothetical protein n=1 Tax=Paenibacillus sp. NFR01 TaxID=1566279 RepID=UPI0008D07153|nr:hypothetical protein [Paenibacillus sp. NFR01]SEU27519.1 hypothetical protein SAMN03159358_4581 [Paenibacillus sp. NFR01]